MKQFARLAFAAAFAAEVQSMATKVTVYEGPKECEDKEKVQKGNFLKMHYTGTIDESSPTGEKKKEFDSSRGRNQTFDFAVGTGQVIQGWDNGLIGLCKGAKATLVIPAEEGYGAGGSGATIPGGATLNFDVEVVDVSAEAPPAQPEENLFETIDEDKSGKLTEEEVKKWFKEVQKQDMPADLMKQEDKNNDGFIDWEEFGGPKGDKAPEVTQ